MTRPGTIVQPWKRVPSEQLEREERQRQRRREQRRKEEIAKEVAEFVPKPLPHTEDFTVQPDWEVAERNANETPSVYVDNKGVRHYAPGSTMWDMGYRTSTEYRGYREAYIDPETGRRKVRTVGGGAVSEHPKSKAPWVATTDWRDKPVHIPKENARELAQLKGKLQFDLAKELKLIPDDATFVKKPDGWAYNVPRYKKTFILTPTALKGKKADLSEFVNTDGKLNLTAAVKAGHTSAGDYAGWKVKQSQINDILAEIKRRNEAEVTLKKYHVYGDTYNTAKAMVDDDPEVQQALRVLFSTGDLEKTQRWIDKHWGVGERLGGEPAKKIVRFYRRVTPWAEEKGETLISKATEIKKKLPISAKIAPVVAPIVATPVPHDDVVLWLLIGGAVAATAVNVAITKKKPISVPTTITEANARFRGTFGHSMTPKDIIVVSATGEVASLYDISPTKYKRDIPWLIPPKVDLTKPGLVPPRVDIKKPGLIPPRAEFAKPGLVPPRVEPVIIAPMPKPTVTKSELTEREGGIISATAGVAVAEENLKQAVPKLKTITIPINWNKILEQAHQAQKQNEINAAFRRLNEAMERAEASKRIAPQVGSHYRKAYEEYLRRRALLEEARKQYVASLNPTPIKGKISDDAVSMFALYTLGKALKLNKPIAGESTATYLERVLGKSFKTISQTATATATKAYTEALAKGATQTQAMAKATTAVQTATTTAVQTLTKTLTKTATKTQTATLTKALTKAITKAAVAQAAVTPAVVTPAVTTTVPKLTVPPPPIYLPLPKGATDQEKREYIKKTKGAVTWNMGKLGGEDIWHIRLPDGQHIVVRGKAPKGAEILADGPGSAYRTTQVIDKRRPAFPKFHQQHGAVKATVQPAKTQRGAQISFTSGMHSVKKGRQYFTKSGSATLISRRPLGRRHR
jgi:hypothetical protein